MHSFTESGMAMNILIGLFALAFPLPMLFLFFRNYKKMPAVYNEENISSREFWMFIGSLIIFLSALFIISVTSVPVYNKIFNTNIADPADREFTYNKVMVLVAMVIGLLTAVAQYFKYKQTNREIFLKKIAVPLITAIIISILLAIFYPVEYNKQGAGFVAAIYLTIFAVIFSALANAGYIWSVLKGNWKAAGGAIAHTGFAIMILGMLISSANKKVVSDNRKTGLFISFGKDPDGKHTEDPLENLTLIKSVPTQMFGYTVTYIGDSAAKEKTRSFYKLQVERRDSSKKITEQFVLTPDVYKMKDNNISSNPDIKHYTSYDVFTYISSLSDKNSTEDTAQYKMHEVKIKDTVFYSAGYFILNSVLKNPDNEKFHFKPTDTALVADITVHSNDSLSYKAYPLLSVSNFDINYVDDTLFAKNLHFRFAGISKENHFKIGLKESTVLSDFITLKAYVFPYINLVWIGLIIMAAGFILSITRRLKANLWISAIALTFVIAGLFYMFLIAN